MPQVYVVFKAEVEGIPFGFDIEEYAEGFKRYGVGTAVALSHLVLVEDSAEAEAHFHESNSRYSCGTCHGDHRPRRKVLTTMATNIAPAASPAVSIETRANELSVGFPIEAEENPAPYVQAGVNYGNDQMQEYGFSNVLLSADGTPYDELDGAAALSRMFVRVFGQEPQGMNWGNNKPVMIQVQVQEFLYEAPDGSKILEFDLDDPRKWSTQRVVEFLDTYLPEFQIPKFFSDAERPVFVAAMRGFLATRIYRAPVSTITVPWGRIRVPGLDGVEIFCTGADGDTWGYPGQVFHLAVTGKKMHAKKIDQIVQSVTEELTLRSIYKNKCWVYTAGTITFHDPFAAADWDGLVLPDAQRHVMDNEVFNLLRFKEEALLTDPTLLDSKIGIVGEAGTGKTTATNLIAQEALRNGFTVAFMNPRVGDSLTDFRVRAVRQAPTFAFIEDFEKLFSFTEIQDATQRDQMRSMVLSEFDGGQAKGKRVLWGLLSNHPEKLIPEAARPGRLDTLLVFKPLTLEGFVLLANKHIGYLLGDDVDLSVVYNSGKGWKASFLAGLIKKVKMYGLGKPAGWKVDMRSLMAIIENGQEHRDLYDQLCELRDTPSELTAHQLVDRAVTPIIQRELAGIVH